MSWHQSGPPILEGEDERELKLAFARYCFENPDLENEAGYAVFPGRENFGRALQAQVWLHDPVVRAERRRLGGTEAEVKVALPTKEQLAKEVVDRARGAVEDKDAVAAYKLAADILGYAEKAPMIDNRTINILKVPARVGTSKEEQDDWGRRFKAQQTKLVADARSARPIAA